MTGRRGLIASLAGALLVSACVNEPILLEALDYDVGPPPDTANLQLAGLALNANDNRGMSQDQAEAFFRVRQGQTVNYQGIVDRITVRGNRADIEILPIKTGFAKRDCQVGEMRRRYGCQTEGTRSFTTVTCRVNDWAALNQATQGRLLGNWRNRQADWRNWDSVHVQGRLANLKPERRNVDIYQGGSTYIGRAPFRTAVWAYDSFVIEECQVRGYDQQRL